MQLQQTVNIKEYNSRMLESDIEEHLIQAEKEIEKGKVIDASEVFEKWSEKYGIQN